MILPRDFQPLSLATMLVRFRANPLGPMLVQHIGLTDEDLAKRIAALEFHGLVQFAISPGGAPSVFTAERSKFTSIEDQELADKLVDFFDVTGNYDSNSGHVVNIKPAQTGLGPICDFCSEPNPKHIEDVPSFNMPIVNQESLGGWATCDTCHEMVKENRHRDLLERAVWKLKLGKMDNTTEPTLRALHRKFWEARAINQRPPIQLKVPHWQEAIDRKFEALRQLTRVTSLGRPGGGGPALSGSMLADFQEDATAMKAADVYSFNGETMHAIMTGAKSIPHESSLKSIELPTAKAGWFWFGEPMPVACSPAASGFTNALLWSYDPAFVKTPTLRFSAYIVDLNGNMKGQLMPSTKWFWPIDASYHQMLALNHKWYKETYSENRRKLMDPMQLAGEEQTLDAIADLSLFFMMACLWFRQTVPGTKKKIDSKLTQEQGHIERHARKRYEKEFKLDAPPTVKVIALRKSQATADSTPSEDGEKKHHLHVRFVVSGHARLQACGPERKDRKLIWIDSFVKGPEDAPFKEAQPKVFAVVR